VVGAGAGRGRDGRWAEGGGSGGSIERGGDVAEDTAATSADSCPSRVARRLGAKKTDGHAADSIGLIWRASEPNYPLGGEARFIVRTSAASAAVAPPRSRSLPPSLSPSLSLSLARLASPPRGQLSAAKVSLCPLAAPCRFRGSRHSPSEEASGMEPL
jgi:hypothetical protein